MTTFDIGTNLSGVLIAFIAIIPATVAAIYARNAAKTAVATHNLVNSRMDELVGIASETSHLEGVLQGEQQQRDRDAPSPNGDKVSKV